MSADSRASVTVRMCEYKRSGRYSLNSPFMVEGRLLLPPWSAARSCTTRYSRKADMGRRARLSTAMELPNCMERAAENGVCHYMIANMLMVCMR